MEVKEDVFEHTAHCLKVGGADAVFVADAELTLPPPLILNLDHSCRPGNLDAEKN